jgi:parallel beta-helix repeat protein/predicted outer membrane repeat protein
MTKSRRKHARGGKLLALLAAALLAAAIRPVEALAADASDAVAYTQDSSGYRVYYATVEEARNVGYGGMTIYMNKDWELGGTFEVADSKTLTINMNGHKISGNNKDTVICVNENANLTLTSDATEPILYLGYYNEDGDDENTSIVSGGLVTAGRSYSNAGGIQMEENSGLTLHNVAVAGNYGALGGGITCKRNCRINIEAGATVACNYSKDYGGGIGLLPGSGDYQTIVSMDNGSVVSNYAKQKGGGIYANTDGAVIYLENNSTISDNTAQNGGGIWFNYTHFHVISEDRTGSINNNKATFSGSSDNLHGGGAIYVDDVSNQEHFGEIRGLTMKGNYSGYAGGAILIDQKYTHVSYCTITENTSNRSGGGIYLNDSNCSVTSCDITGNVCNGKGNNYEGGGIFVSSKYDLTLDGVCNITGNTRGKNGSADDLFLNDKSGSHAYILGGVDKDSKVGIRTGMTDDQMIGKNITNYTYGTYFIDLDGYYVSKGTDHGGDLWQRHRKLTYLAQVNGTGDTRYNQGDTVTLDGTSTDPGKTFVRWSQESSTGLYPFEDIVTDPTNPKVTFTMPQNDVNLVAEYATAEVKLTITAQRPVIDEQPPETATLSWGDGHSKQVDIEWVDEDGEEPFWVRDDEEYRLVLVTGSDQSAGLLLPSSIDASQVSIVYADAPEADPVSVQDAHIDSDGNLNVTSQATEAVVANPENGGGDDVLPDETGPGPYVAVGLSIALAIVVIVRLLKD